jgi:hypothetical protein
MTPNRAAATNPYPGLRPFEEREEHLFFGRERQIDRMVDLLSQRRFLALVGGSGSGKSSLVSCGLQPALRRGLMASAGTTWRMVRFRPGLRPIDAMAQALAIALTPADGDASSTLAAAELSRADVIGTQLRLSRLGLVEVGEQAGIAPHNNLLVVVDQFEEIFRYQALAEGQKSSPGRTVEQGEAQALVNLLLATAAQPSCPIHVVLTMRSDFLGDCAQFPGLPEAITASLHLVPRLSRQERRQAIALPALVSGSEVDPVLLTQLVNDVGDDPDQLSILQHALRRTWHHWQQRGGQGPLTLADYEAIGTMATALDSHAEQTLAEVTSTDGDDGLLLASRLFRALTDKATDPRGIRRPTTLAELRAICGGEPVATDRLVNHFRQSDRAFLMPPEGDPLTPSSVVDISHESLMRVWRRLDQWADQEADSAALFLRLADAAARHGCGEASLWRDPELELALDWQQREQPTEAWAQRYATNQGEAFAFLKASREAREGERRQLEWRRRRTMAGLVAFSLLAAAVGGFSWWQWQNTRLSRARAYAANAASTLEQRPLQSMLYSLAALERLAQEPAEALGAAYTLARASLRNWELEQWEINPGGMGRPAITALLGLRDGTAMTAADCGPGPAEGRSCLQRWRGRVPLGKPIPTDEEGVTALLELANGQLVTGSASGRLRLWQLQPSLKPLAVSEPTASAAVAIHSLVQLSDGEIVSGDEQGTLRRWRSVNRRGGVRLEPLAAPIATGVSRIVLLALPDGALLSGGADRNNGLGTASLQFWRRGRPIGPPLRTGQTVVRQLLLWGEQVLSVGSEGRVEQLTPTGSTSQLLELPSRGLRPDVEKLVVLAGGRALLSVHSDGTLRQWVRAQNAAGPRVMQLQAVGQADSRELLQLVDVGGGRLLAADANHKIRLLQHPDPRMEEGERTGLLNSGQTAVNSLLAVSETQLISGGEDGRLCFWVTGRRLERLPLKQGRSGSNCLMGDLGSDAEDQEPGAVLLASLPGGEMLSVTNVTRYPTSDGPHNTVVVQRWHQGGGKDPNTWMAQRLPTPRAWFTILKLLSVGDGEILSLGSMQSDPSRSLLWRWNPLQPELAPVALQLRDQNSEPMETLGWFRAIGLPRGDLLSSAAIGGSLQHWYPHGNNTLKAEERMDTGLDAISALAVLPGGRHLVIASGQQAGEAASVQLFDRVQKVWVGQPIPIPRPFGQDSGTVAATALAFLPGKGLAIGTNRGDLLTIQPHKIQADACRELEPLLRGSGLMLERGNSAMPAGTLRLSRKACGL